MLRFPPHSRLASALAKPQMSLVKLTGPVARMCRDCGREWGVSLLSTNAVVNSFRNTRRKLGHVTRFRTETEQASRWLSFSLLEVEKGFRRISGHRDLGALVKALQRKPEPEPEAEAEPKALALESKTG